MDETWAEELDLDACLARLRSHAVGRLAVVTDDYPIVLPVNYRLVEALGVTWLALRTRPGNVIDQAPKPVAFEIDDVDPGQDGAWSVLVRGTLARVDSEAADFRERFDPHPWLAAERDAWLVIEPFSITGRVLHSAEETWAYHPRAYL